MDAIQTRTIARSIFEELQKFYSNPENVKKFEAWKEEREKRRERIEDAT